MIHTVLDAVYVPLLDSVVMFVVDSMLLTTALLVLTSPLDL